MAHAALKRGLRDAQGSGPGNDEDKADEGQLYEAVTAQTSL